MISSKALPSWAGAWPLPRSPTGRLITTWAAISSLPGPGSSSGGSGGRPTRPSGLREREVSVAANVAWNDTGIDLRPGQTVYFEATGRVLWAPNRRDGPAGETNLPRKPNRPMANRPAGALIGRIGEESSDYFFIGGDEGPIRAAARGRLFLGINDDYPIDNSGSFRVTVYY